MCAQTGHNTTQYESFQRMLSFSACLFSIHNILQGNHQKNTFLKSDSLHLMQTLVLPLILSFTSDVYFVDAFCTKQETFHELCKHFSGSIFSCTLICNKIFISIKSGMNSSPFNIHDQFKTSQISQISHEIQIRINEKE